MANVIKSTLKKSRDKFLADIKRTLERQDSKLDALDTKLETIQAEQRLINQNKLAQQAANNEAHERIKNSGTIQISENEIVTKIFTGIKIYLDPRDIAVAPHLALDAIWEEPITKAWLAVIKPHDIVMDIGANFGYYGLLAAQKTDKKKSKVIFFEANPNLIPYLSKTLSVNWFNEQSIVENLAVADKGGKVTLNILKDYIGCSSLHTAAHINKYMHSKMHDLQTASTVTVQAITIDSYCQKYDLPKIDLIKMDIEGFEDKAYQGMRKTVQSSPNLTLFIEFTKDSYDAPKQFYDQMLKDFGHVYVINSQGNIVKPSNTSYGTVIGQSDDWVMPVFSKNDSLAKA